MSDVGGAILLKSRPAAKNSGQWELILLLIIIIMTDYLLSVARDYQMHWQYNEECANIIENDLAAALTTELQQQFALPVVPRLTDRVRYQTPVLSLLEPLETAASLAQRLVAALEQTKAAFHLKQPDELMLTVHDVRRDWKQPALGRTCLVYLSLC